MRCYGVVLFMHLSAIQGVIDRRILVNYRIDPEVLQRLLPAPFRVKQVHGYGIAGICLIRLVQMRPRLVPAFLGWASENAAHRIAVTWQTDGGEREGVYVPRRDTSSRLNVWLGGRVFPGKQHRATFAVRESDRELSVALRSVDDATRVSVAGHVVTELPASSEFGQSEFGLSVFGTLAAASQFFANGSVGYSATSRAGCFDCIELCSRTWQVEPLAVEQVHSSFFEDQDSFPAGSVAFDSALLMRGIRHEWLARDPMRTPQ